MLTSAELTGIKIYSVAGETRDILKRSLRKPRSTQGFSTPRIQGKMRFNPQKSASPRPQTHVFNDFFCSEMHLNRKGGSVLPGCKLCRLTALRESCVFLVLWAYE